MSGLLSLKWNNHSSVFLNLLQSLRIKELYCDTTIVCHSKFYPVHKLVLSTCSEYFQDIFERIECKHPFIIMKEVEPSQLEALLNYMYKGEVNVLQESLPGLIKAAEALKIKGLAVPDDAANKEKSSPLRERKRTMNSSFNLPSKTRRLEENIEPIENFSQEANCSRGLLNKETGVDKAENSPTHDDLDNSSGHFGATSEYNDNSDTEKDPQPEFNAFVKSEPVDETDRSPEIKPKEEETSSFNFASLLPSDSDASETIKTMEESYRAQSNPLFSVAESYQDCYSSSSTMRDGVSLPWPAEGRPGTSNDQDMDGTLVPASERTQQAVPPLVPPLPHFLTKQSRKSPPGGLNPSPHDPMNDLHQQPFNKHNCSFCPYGSYSSSAVKKHEMRIHTGLKPFQCNQCNYSSTTKESLRIHFRSHTGEKPYQCHQCRHKSSCYANLKKHIKTVHNKC